MTGAPRPAAARLDARLAIPALIGWSAVAALLGCPEDLLAWCGLAVLGAGGVSVAWLRLARRSVLSWSGTASLIVVTVLVTGGLLVIAAGQGATRKVGRIVDLARERATIQATGAVVSDPRVIAARPGVGRGTDMVVMRVQLDAVTARGYSNEARAPILVFGDPQWKTVRWGARLRFVARLGEAQAGDDVVAVATPRGPPEEIEGPGLLADAAQHVRHRLQAAVTVLPGDARGLLPGLVLGDTSAASETLTADMRITGLTHLSAVSGSNVTLVLAAVIWLCGWLRVPRWGRAPVALTALVGFVVLVRPDPSVLRAAVMGSIGLLGLSASLRRAGLPALGAGVVLLLAYDPWLARSLGFGLSVLATLGLLIWARSWTTWIAARLPSRWGWAGPAIAVPLAAQAMCAPLMVVIQGSVSLISLPANIIAAPLVAPATICGVVTAVISAVWLPLAHLVVWASGIPTMGIAEVARIGADVPFGTMAWPAGWVGSSLLAVLTLVILGSGRWMAFQAKARPIGVAAVILVAFAAFVPTRLVTWPMTGWQFVACDVGQGDGLVLRTESDHAVVVDVGLDPTLIDGCLSRLRVTQVDALILTHYHADHVDGLPGALRGRTVHQILVTPVAEPAYQVQQVREQAAVAGIPIATLYAGDLLRFGDTAWRVWWPVREIHEGSIPNNGSLVVTVEKGDFRALLLADVEREGARELLDELRAAGVANFSLVKVAHHGSANRVDELYAFARAPVAVISVGAGNDYGHPAASTVDLLDRLGYRVWRTDESGDVAVRVDRDGIVDVACRGP